MCNSARDELWRPRLCRVGRSISLDSFAHECHRITFFASRSSSLVIGFAGGSGIGIGAEVIGGTSIIVAAAIVACRVSERRKVFGREGHSG